jgi:hypothetical protein
MAGEAMKCPECQTELPDGAKFCLDWGHVLIPAAKISSLDYRQPHSYTPKQHVDKLLINRNHIEGGAEGYLVDVRPLSARPGDAGRGRN